MEDFNKSQERSGDGELRSKIEVVLDDKGETSNVFVVEGDKKFDLYNFLPKGVRFVGSDKIGYGFHSGDPGSDHPPLVTFPPEEANSVSGRLGILHEMGHAIDAEHDQYRLRYYDMVQRHISIIVRSIKQSAEYKNLKRPQDRGDFIVKEFQKNNDDSSVPIPDGQVLEAVKNTARSERTAWANALHLYRRIKKEEGVDLLDGAGGKEIFKIVRKDLGSYQDTYGMLVPEQKIKLFLIKKYLSQDPGRGKVV